VKTRFQNVLSKCNLRRYSEAYHSIEYLLGFFLMVVWIVPFGFFISLAANESVLPSGGLAGSGGGLGGGGASGGGMGGMGGMGGGSSMPAGAFGTFGDHGGGLYSCCIQLTHSA
jgi:hypothetical protein